MSPRIFAKVRLTPIAMAYFIANPPALSMPGQGGFFVARAGYGKIAVPYPVTYLYLPFRAKQKARKPAEMLGKLVCLPKLACKNKRVGYGVRNNEHKGGGRSAPPCFYRPQPSTIAGAPPPRPRSRRRGLGGQPLLPLRDSVFRVAAASPERLFLLRKTPPPSMGACLRSRSLSESGSAQQLHPFCGGPDGIQIQPLGLLGHIPLATPYR